MADVLRLLDEARRLLEEEGHDTLAREIKQAMADPEMRIKTAQGEITVGLNTTYSTDNSKQAYIAIDDPYIGPIDLALVELPGAELAKANNVKEGDIRLMMWGDIYSEDYTNDATIKSEDLLQVRIDRGYTPSLEQYPSFDVSDENAIDEICGMIEELGVNENVFFELCSDQYILNIEALRNGSEDTFDLITSIQDEDGNYVVVDEERDVDLIDLYNTIMDIAIEYDKERGYEYDEER